MKNQAALDRLDLTKLSNILAEAFECPAHVRASIIEKTETVEERANMMIYVCYCVWCMEHNTEVPKTQDDFDLSAEGSAASFLAEGLVRYCIT